MDFTVHFYIVQCQFKMQIEEHFAHMQEHQNHRIFMSWLVHACVFHCYQNNGNTAQNLPGCFCFTSCQMHILPTLSTFLQLTNGLGKAGRKGIMGSSIFPFPSMSIIQYEWLANTVK